MISKEWTRRNQRAIMKKKKKKNEKIKYLTTQMGVNEKRGCLHAKDCLNNDLQTFGKGIPVDLVPE
jgi:hypothetical protein